MQPDRTNYELLFTNWLDGKLDEHDLRLLSDFLKNNPDLLDELKSLESIKLKSPESSFRKKDDLYRKPADIDDSQFDYLCIASLENDITPGEKADLDEIISQDIEKKNRFLLYQKLRLKPPESIFIKKSSVKKLTTGSQIFRMSLAGLSAAAVVLLFVIPVFISRPTGNAPGESIAINTTMDTLYIPEKSPLLKNSEPLPEPKMRIIYPDPVAGISGLSPANNYIGSEIGANLSPPPVMIRHKNPGSISYAQTSQITEMLTLSGPDIKTLRTYKPHYVPDYIDNTMSNVDRLVAKIFHRKIMLDTIMPERPIERFELASAGITGLNKILGWDMMLEKDTDEDGNVSSISFTSALIKIKTPGRRSLKSL